MTIKIKKSALMCSPEEFAEHVEGFKGVMREYQAHLEGVRADAENHDLKPEDRRVAFPPPMADPLIERAAAEGYEIEGPSLAEKKAALFAEVRRMESEALQAIIPPAKARHWEFRVQEILAAHAPRIPTGDDGAFVDDIRSRKAKQTAMQRHFAKIEHDIADLTEETIDGWTMDVAWAFK
jgi:hypothetical protein